MAASDAIYPSWSKSLLEAIKAKGPSTQTEATHRTVKEIYKKMVALCKPLQRFRVTTEDGEELVSASQVAPVWASAGDVIILAEQPLTIGMPPGLSQAEQFAEFEEDLGALYEKISRADKTSNSKAVGAHSKLVVLAIQIKIILECQRQQLRIDQDLRKVQMAFLQVVGLGSFSPLGVKGGGALEQLVRIQEHHAVATKAATELASTSEGGAVLLCPTMDGDWGNALRVAKSLHLLKQDFPDLNIHPLCKIAAIEVRAVPVRRRQGIRRITAVEGKLRLVTASEFELLQKIDPPDAKPEYEGSLEVWRSRTAGESVMPTSWVIFPQNTDGSEALLFAELLEVNATHIAAFSSALEDFMSKFRWFDMKMAGFRFRRQRYAGKPLNFHWSIQEMWTYAKTFIECLANNIMEQLPQPTDAMKNTSQGRLLSEARESLNTLLEMPCPTENDAGRAAFEEDLDEEKDEDEQERYEYLMLQPELSSQVLHQPPFNIVHAEEGGRLAVPGVREVDGRDHPPQERPQPGSLGVGASAPPGSLGAGASAPPGSLGAGASAPPATQRRSPPPTVEFRQPRSRASSGDSWAGEEEEREERGARFSPPPTTASQWRGEDKTHSIALQLQRARQQLNVMVADPSSTKYKEQRRRVREMLNRAEKHLTDDLDISASYEEFLVEEMNQAETDCSTKDDELDLAQKKKKKIEDDKKDLLATLPRGLGAKFSGTAAEYPGFRHYFVEINQSVSGPLAVSHMTALIDDKTQEGKRLAKRLKIYKNGDELIADLDKDFGHSFLNCQHILNKMNQLKRATTESEEMSTIVQFRQAKRALDLNADHEKLLNIPQLIQMADLLLPSTCKELMKIIQQKGFGEEGSATERYFAHLEEVYEQNSVLIRNREARMPVQDQRQSRKQGRTRWEEADQRAYGLEDQNDGDGCGAFCKSGRHHRPYACPLLKQGKIPLKVVKQAGLCACCVADTESCKKGVVQGKDGKPIPLTCPKCKNHKKINCHQNCKVKPVKQQQGAGGVGGAVGSPPVQLNGGAAVGASLTELRTEMTVLVNPNSLGAALEMVDYAMLVAPDGSTMRVRTIYDNGGTDCMLDWRLDRFFHHKVPVTVGINSATETRKFRSEVGELRIVNAQGASFSLKALKSDLSGRAFAIRRKFVDVPPRLHHHFGPSYQHVNEVGDIRHYNISEGATDQVQLVIGLDAVALSPMELDRDQDENGQLIMWKSVISDRVLVSGSRKSGSAASVRNNVDHRSYVILEEGSQPVTFLRTAVDLGIEDSRELFVKRKNLSKVERKLFCHIEDGDQLVPPQPELCPSCQGCEVCKDPFKARRDRTVNQLMDQLVTFKDAPREQKGGYHIKLIYDPDLLAKVSEGRGAALRRLLSTEKQLLRPGMEGALHHFNKKMKQCQERGYLVRPEELDLSDLQRSYQPISFALKDEEKLTDSQLPGAPDHKTKARPVIDSSSIAEPGGVSVNGAQYKIPDIHTLKISQILLQLRTAKHFAIADVSEFYFRLWCDPLTSSLTRILFREGGLGTNGKIIELVPPVASMGMREISSFSAHVRYRISLSIKDQDPAAAQQLRKSYCDDVTVFEKFDENEGDYDSGDCDGGYSNGRVLVARAMLVEKALNHAHLFLGEKWITDVNQEVCGESMTGVTEGAERAVNLGSSSCTSALGYRLHLGPEYPPGGSLLWKVHRPQSLNLEPKKRGARPEWSQLATPADIQDYLQNQGVTKAALLSLCSCLFDPLLLAAVFISTARQLFRRVLREVNLCSWKAKVPEKYHGQIAYLAEDLLEVSKRLRLPRLAVIPNQVLDLQTKFLVF